MRSRLPERLLLAALVLVPAVVFADPAPGNSQQAASAAKADNAVASTRSKLPYPDVPRIRAEEVYKLIKSGGKVVLIDTDNPIGYGAEHIKGAVNVVYDPTVDISNSDQTLQALPGDKLLVFYCNCPHEEDSAPMVQEMWQLNYARDKVKALEGGLNRWEELGYPLAGTDLPASDKE